ncbi:MAG: ABC transporter substrate-binding protein [Saccharospirillum sp.]
MILLLRASLIGTLVMALTACGGSAEPVDAEGPQTVPVIEEDPSETVPGPVYGGELSVGMIGESPYDAAIHAQQDTARALSALLFSGLMVANEQMQMVPDIARAEPEISDDGRLWRFELKPGVRFHDGTELTAEDVVFTYRRLMDEAVSGSIAGRFNLLERVEALNEHQVLFTLSEPDARFWSLAGYAVLPRHRFESAPMSEASAGSFSHPELIGSGPFRVRQWNGRQTLALAAFEDYHKGRPWLDRVTFRFADDVDILSQWQRQGALDLVQDIPVNQGPLVENATDWVVEATPAQRYDFIGYNLRNTLFEDARVRQALTHALDRQGLVASVMAGRATVAHAPVSPWSWAYNDAVPVFGHDPQRARRLLAQAGWSPGEDGILQKDGERFAFELLYNEGSHMRRQVGIRVQQHWADVGIEVTLRPVDWTGLLTRLQAPTARFDAVILAWPLVLDPDPSSIWHSREAEAGLNRTGYSNPTVDALIIESLGALNQAERASHLAQIWSLLAQDQPYTFLWYPHRYTARGVSVRGFAPHPWSSSFSLPNVWIDP